MQRLVSALEVNIRLRKSAVREETEPSSRDFTLPDLEHLLEINEAATHSCGTPPPPPPPLPPWGGRGGAEGGKRGGGGGAVCT